MESHYIMSKTAKPELRRSFGARRELTRDGMFDDGRIRPMDPVVEDEPEPTGFQRVVGSIVSTKRPWFLFALGLLTSAATAASGALFYLEYANPGSRYSYWAPFDSGLSDYHLASAVVFGVLTGISALIALCAYRRYWKAAVLLISTAMVVLLVHILGGLVFFMFGMGDPKLISSETMLYTSVIVFALQFAMLKGIRFRSVWENMRRIEEDEEQQQEASSRVSELTRQ